MIWTENRGEEEMPRNLQFCEPWSIISGAFSLKQNPTCWNRFDTSNARGDVCAIAKMYVTLGKLVLDEADRPTDSCWLLNEKRDHCPGIWSLIFDESPPHCMASVWICVAIKISSVINSFTRIQSPPENVSIEEFPRDGRDRIYCLPWPAEQLSISDSWNKRSSRVRDFPWSIFPKNLYDVDII